MTDNLPAVRVETSHDLVNPTTDSWTVALAPVIELARSICGTDFVPESMRNNVASTTAAIMYGRELGLPPMTALGSTHMIKGRVGVSAEILRALVLEQGHEIVVRESSGGQVVMAGRRKGTTDWTVVTWTLDDARRAKLAGDNWTKYPRQMLAARASAELCRLIFADVIHGMAATEELEGIDSPSMTGPAVATGNGAKVQRKTRTTKADDGAVPPADAPTASGPPAALSSPLPPLPGEPGYDDGPDTPALAGEVATSTTEPLPSGGSGPADASDPGDGSAVSDRRVSGRSVEVPPGQVSQTDDGAAAPPADQGAANTPAAESATTAAPSSSLPPLPGEEDLPEPAAAAEDITDQQRKKLFALMGEHGLTNKDQQIGWISKNLGREIDSRAEVNKDDAIKLIDLLERLGTETPRPVGRGDLRLLAGLFRDLDIADQAERLHIASSIIGRTPMKEGQPSAEGLTAAEGKLLIEALGRCKNREHVEALVQLAEQERARDGGEQ